MRPLARRALPALLLLLAGCAVAAPPESAACLPGQQRMLVAELFFGRAIPGRAPLSEAEWARFAAEVLTPNFPAGFTVFDGDGQWQNPATHEILRERTKIVLVALNRAADLARRLSAAIDAYKTRFHQRSVGLITRQSCAAF